MAGRIFLGALLAAVAMMIWGFIFWAALPFGEMSIKSVPNEESVRSSISQNLTETGVYYIPGMNPNALDKAAADKEWKDKHLAGPLVMVIFSKDGAQPMAPGTLIGGFLVFFVGSVLVAILLAMALPELPMYSQRVLFVFIAGLFAALSIYLGQMNWWHFPLQFTLTSIAAEVIAWLIAGLILARVLSPGTASVRISGEAGSMDSIRSRSYTFQPPVRARK